MIYFCFTDLSDQPTVMSALVATDRESALSEAEAALRDYPGAVETHVFDGDQFVSTVTAPSFGFAGVNNTRDFGLHETDPEPARRLAS
jgi:hypothetical protein